MTRCSGAVSADHDGTDEQSYVLTGVRVETFQEAPRTGLVARLTRRRTRTRPSYLLPASVVSNGRSGVVLCGPCADAAARLGLIDRRKEGR